MKTVMQTITIAILLVATLSCNKENANSTALNTTNHATSSAAIQDNQELIGFSSPVGNWVLYFDWGCTGGYGAINITVNADGTWSGGGYSGTWIDGRGVFMLNFSAPSRTTYSGTERIKRIVGIMSAFGTPDAVPYPGCFYMERANSASFKSYKVPGMPDVMGIKALK